MARWLVCIVVAVLWSAPARAEPILYTFDGTVDLRKFSRDSLNEPTVPPDIAAFLDGYWLPGLSTGTYAITGSILYDASPLMDDDPLTWQPNLVTVLLGPYAFTIGGDLGRFASPAEFNLVTSGPSVLNPTPPGWFGEDGWARFFNPTGLDDGTVPLTLDGFQTGEMFFLGRGFYTDPKDSSRYMTWVDWHGKVENIQEVPEPATWLLIGLGSAGLLKRRRGPVKPQ